MGDGQSPQHDKPWGSLLTGDGCRGGPAAQACLPGPGGSSTHAGSEGGREIAEAEDRTEAPRQFLGGGTWAQMGPTAGVPQGRPLQLTEFFHMLLFCKVAQKMKLREVK